VNTAPTPGPSGPGPPLWLLLELTYRCPLHCVFCYNPTEFARTGAELPTEDWLRVLREARALGAVQLGLSGGEPMVLNVVLHRLNIDHVGEILDMAERLGAQYVELANTQYYGWAWLNRQQLLPSRAQLARAEAATQRFRERVAGRIQVYFVVPDYFERRPKACMGGLGSVFLGIAPDGIAMPCHAARMLPGLDLPNVRSADIRTIWYDSPAFNRFRGEAWMKEPCRSCPERTHDFGGCRCQAYLLTGDATNTDPVCDLSPHHQLVTDAVARAERDAALAARAEHVLVFRDHRISIKAP